MLCRGAVEPGVQRSTVSEATLIGRLSDTAPVKFDLNHVAWSGKGIDDFVRDIILGLPLVLHNNPSCAPNGVDGKVALNQDDGSTPARLS